MKERFEGENAANLLDAIKRQDLVDGDAEAAAALTDVGTLCEFMQGDYIVRQNGEDDDVYLLIAGAVAIVVNGNNIATRKARQHVGEMAAVESSQKRSADVVAAETVVALKITSVKFREICVAHPRLWLSIARELSRRLFARNQLIASPNDSPRLFIISSAEALKVADQLQLGLKHKVLARVWTDGVFFAGGYALEALEEAVERSDFAVAIAQPDDIVESRGGRAATLRDNVLFELGLFMGKLTRYRTILIHPKVAGLKLPSDLQGLTMISYEEGKPEELAMRLAPVCTEIAAIVDKLGVYKVIDK